MGNLMYVYGPDGKLGTIPEEQWPQAQLEKYKQETYGSQAARNRPMASALLAASDSFSLGIPNYIASRAGVDLSPQRDVEKFNPKMATVGSLAGAGAQAAMGLSTAKYLKSAFGASVLDGTLQGLGMELNDTALENRDLSAERLATYGALGGLTGGLFHGAAVGVGAAWRGAKYLKNRFLGEEIAKTLNDYGQRTLEGAVSEASVLEKQGLRASEAEDVVASAEREGVLTPITAGHTAETYKNAVAKQAAAAESARAKIGALDEFLPPPSQAQLKEALPDTEFPKKNLSWSELDKHAANLPPEERDLLREYIAKSFDGKVNAFPKPFEVSEARTKTIEMPVVGGSPSEAAVAESFDGKVSAFPKAFEVSEARTKTIEMPFGGESPSGPRTKTIEMPVVGGSPSGPRTKTIELRFVGGSPSEAAVAEGYATLDDWFGRQKQIAEEYATREGWFITHDPNLELLPQIQKKIPLEYGIPRNYQEVRALLHDLAEYAGTNASARRVGQDIAMELEVLYQGQIRPRAIQLDPLKGGELDASFTGRKSIARARGPNPSSERIRSQSYLDLFNEDAKLTTPQFARKFARDAEALHAKQSRPAVAPSEMAPAKKLYQNIPDRRPNESLSETMKTANHLSVVAESRPAVAPSELAPAAPSELAPAKKLSGTMKTAKHLSVVAEPRPAVAPSEMAPAKKLYQNIPDRRPNESLSSVMKTAKHLSVVAESIKSQIPKNRDVTVAASIGAYEGFKHSGLYGAFAGAIGGAGAAAVKNVVAARVPIQAGLALRAGSEKIVDAMATRMGQRIRLILGMSPSALGIFRRPLEWALTQGNAELLGVHKALADGPRGAEYLGLLGMTPGDGSTKHVFDKVSVLAGVAHADVVAQQKLMSDANHFLVPGTLDKMVYAPLPKFERSAKEVAFPTVAASDFDATVKVMAQTLKNPEEVFKAFENPALPELGATAADTTLRGVKFLLREAPKNPFADTTSPMRRPWAPSGAELRDWNHLRNVLSHPNEMISAGLRQPMLSSTRKALEAVFPATLENARQTLIEKLSEQTDSDGKIKKPLSFGQQQVLGALMGTTVKVEGLNVTFIQQATSAPPSKDKEGPPMASVDGRQVVSQTKNLETQAQRIEGR